MMRLSKQIEGRDLTERQLHDECRACGWKVTLIYPPDPASTSFAAKIRVGNDEQGLIEISVRFSDMLRYRDELYGHLGDLAAQADRILKFAVGTEEAM